MFRIYDAKLPKEGLQEALNSPGFGQITQIIKANLIKRINGDNSLRITAHFNENNMHLLQSDRLIAYERQLYRIIRPKRENKNGNIMHVEAQHIVYDLSAGTISNIETKEDPSFVDGINARQALEQVLDGSKFDVGIVDVEEKLDYLDILEQKRSEAIKTVINTWGGEIHVDNYTINLRKQIGQNNGVVLRMGRNIDGIEFLEDISGIVTRMHVFGYQGANFKDINDGKDFIDSPNIEKYANIYEDYAYFEDEEDPQTLLNLGKKELEKRDKPLFSVRVNLLKLTKHEAYAELERVETGDTVTVLHDLIAEPIALRAIEIERDCITGLATNLVLGDIDQEGLFFSLSETVHTAETVSRTLDKHGKLKGQSIRGAIDLMGVKLLASAIYQNAVVEENRGILLENNNESSPDYGAIYLGAGFLAIANSKDEEGKWIWRSFGTGKGFAGDEILAHSIGIEQIRGDVGKTLDISSNTAIISKVDQQALNERMQTEIEQRSNEINFKVEAEQQRAMGVEGGLQSNIDIYNTHFTFDLSGLTIGKSGNVFKTKLGSEKLSFLENGKEVAYIQHNKLYIKRAEIESVLTVGNSVSGYTDVETVGGGFLGTYRTV